MNMEDGRQLILQAFEQARDAGKPDWYRMTTAVLKNRLLALTGNTFDEAAYGAATFTGFMSEYDDLVDLDRSSFPPVVELRQMEPDMPVPVRNAHSPQHSPHRGAPSGRPRVRSDLWRAALDYSSRTQYVWDEVEGKARPSRPGDDSPVIPTVSQGSHQEWREEFIADIESRPITPEEEYQLDTWIQNQLPTSHLPRPLIGQWNGFLRDKVHRYLLDWFEDSGLEPPQDLFAASAVERPPRQWSSSSDTEDLRQLVLRTVREMTDDELAQLSLPSRAVLRATKSSW